MPKLPAPAGKAHRSPWQATKDFYWKAYEENITGLSGMVAYNLLLSVFPLALLALFIAGQVLQSGDLESSVLRDLERIFPNATDQTARRRARPGPRQHHGLRRRRAGREHLDRVVVLGRARHGVLPDLPRALPHLGRAEALRGGDARRRPAVHRGDGVCPGDPEPPRHQHRRPAARALGGATGSSTRSRSSPASSLLFAILCVIYWTVPNRVGPVARDLAGRARRDRRDHDRSTTRSRPTSRTSRR